MMKKLGGLLAAIALAAAGEAPISWAHGSQSHKHVCTKDGKVIKVKGKTDDEKKASCEKKGGDWVKED